MVFFSEFFSVDEDILDGYGALDISLINDLPLFIDPFLLFGSEKQNYQDLHQGIIKYLTFLKEKSLHGINEGNIKSWYMFPEVKQNWLGFSLFGNGGSGLGIKFANGMSSNLGVVYPNINNEKIPVSTHLEKVLLFEIGVGKDNISDFTCNLIKSYLLKYTETFAMKFLEEGQRKKFKVDKVYFDYTLERWMPETFELPFYQNDYIILTPKDILTKEDTWINGADLRGKFHDICQSVPNDQQRSEINNYFKSKLPPPTFIGKGRKRRQKKPTVRERLLAINQTLGEFPELLDYYIKLKEGAKSKAKSQSKQEVQEVEVVFKQHVRSLINALKETDFYQSPKLSSYDESLKRILFLKEVIEDKDGYKLFYYQGKPIKREADLQVIYRLTWFSSPFDVNREVNNGRGPVDYTISKGSADKTVVEFKLASNSKLKMNLQHQVEIYKKANSTDKGIKVILHFDNFELARVNVILKELGLQDDDSIILIDAGGDKPSASNVKQ